ncbi:hypothetical protein [Mesobacillus foraminis]|uniref:hypothetical protein n=1 Tax=Mesobacillus foraminis TaxID=279826 RepID=UPI0013CEF246|nr:hypothetical protein [Mesobacillus foraminis]
MKFPRQTGTYRTEKNFDQRKGLGGSMQNKKYSLYKNGVYLHDFDTITECSKWLENFIGGTLYQGLSRIRDGKWTPDEKSQLFGYEIKTN